ncbi:MAG TPA: 1-pyrroline-5-carboxylate dehydrogenase, partial [Nocardioides sp.]|nr:1-pyrroline-5-carboxylate dehydrogenase [Nocardioides sp.]
MRPDAHPHVAPADSADLLAEVETQVRQWLDVAAEQPVHPSARRLAEVLEDPHGLEFTVGFVDRVVRPEDDRVAARALRELVPLAPSFLPWHLKLGLRLGALLSVVAPWLVIPLARLALRRMVGHLLIDARPARLGAHIARLRERGVHLNINLLGEAVLGEAEANRRYEGTRELLERPDVDYVSIKVSSPVAPHSPWSYDQAVEHVVERLLPLYRYAA